MYDWKPTKTSDGWAVAPILGGELREFETPEGTYREVTIELPESKWDDVVAADVDELILKPVDEEE